MAANFKQVQQIDVNGHKITKFRSSQTGLSVVHVENEGPIVNGYFTLATESFDDDGCPHTLEHLVFLGSELYPYKGVLDGLANRALANGTNAWTDVDHTAYTIATAGIEGFLNIMPIYIDHILYPTMTEAAYYTEVHNINGDGENAGVVYCEMQGRENSAGSIMDLCRQRIMYPESSGYRYETGGLMLNLRSLEAEKIRQYHRDYYRPDNLCLIISGVVDHGKLLAALGPVEERIISKGPLPPMKRPWVDSPQAPLMSETTKTIVTFPSEDEDMGEVAINWFGAPITDFLTFQALDIVETYLTDSAVSVLQKEMVEIEDPYCTSVEFYTSQRIRTEIKLSFDSVPTEKLEEVEPKFFAILDKIVKEGFDMDRMAAVIKREKLKLLDRLETDHMTLAWPCLVHSLYGKKDDSDLAGFTNDLDNLDKVATFDNATWVKYLREYYVDSKRATVIAKPSAAHAAKQAEDEANRIEEQRKRLGEKKLKELEEALQKHQAQNDIPVPAEIFDNFPIPDVKGIEMIKVITGRSQPDKHFDNEVQKHIDSDPAKVPYFIEYDHIKSEFVELTLFFTSTDLPSHLRPYLDIYFDSFYSLPLVDPATGKETPFEQVVKLLDQDTVSRACGVGVGGMFRQLALVILKTEKAKYSEGIAWLQKMTWHTRFDIERLKVITTKLLNDIPQQKRDGSRMSKACMDVITYDHEKSNIASLNIFQQSKFLADVLKQLEKEPEVVVKALTELREILTRPANIHVQVQGNILQQNEPKAAWVKNFGAKETSATLAPIPFSSQVWSEAGKAPGKKGFVVNMPSIESSFASHVARGPTDFLDPDYAALLVLAECLDTLEGPFWKQLRGSGAVYGANLRVDVEAGFLSFTIYRSPDALRAYNLAAKIVEDYASGKTKFTKQELEGAKASIVYRIVRKEETISGAATEAFVNQVLKKVSANYNKEFLERVQAVTPEQMQHAMDKYLRNVFSADNSIVVVTSATTKVKDISEGFKKIGFQLETKNIDDI
ncbi:presequence protease [Entomortierella parvispora]|uniref:Presequence protease n=1 Tax=Entomortierella parvispora TaxID=205924 RepID=A0A9P3M1V2_9FUNG|nr:presequence protease [Entomortierella parvispora]